MIFNNDDDDDDDDETPPESITNGNICAGLTNDQGPDERSEQMTMNSIDPMSRREKKMHERWLTATTTSSADKSHNHEQASKNVLLGVAFPPIAVLRRKFSSKPNTTETNTLGKLHADSSVESQVSKVECRRLALETETSWQLPSVTAQCRRECDPKC